MAMKFGNPFGIIRRIFPAFFKFVGFLPRKQFSNTQAFTDFVCCQNFVSLDDGLNVLIAGSKSSKISIVLRLRQSSPNKRFVYLYLCITVNSLGYSCVIL